MRPMARILVIDDDDLLRSMLVSVLRHAGHDVRETDNGSNALRLVQADPVDLVITDIVMPDTDGIETIMQLRRALPELPIIAMSGGATHSKLYLKVAEKLGARRILGKPFMPADALRLADEVLQGRS